MFVTLLFILVSSLIGALTLITGVGVVLLTKGPSRMWMAFKWFTVAVVIFLMGTLSLFDWKFGLLICSALLIVDLLFSIQAINLKEDLLRKDLKRVINQNTIWCIWVSMAYIMCLNKVTAQSGTSIVIPSAIMLAVAIVVNIITRYVCANKIKTMPSDEDIKLERSRKKAQKRMSRASVAGLGAGAVSGATVSGFVQGTKLSSDVVATEALIMRTESVAAANDRLENSNVSPEQAAYIQKQVTDAHKLASSVTDNLAAETQDLANDAIDAGFELVRQKLTGMGISIAGLTDDEIAKIALSYASDAQLEELPDGLTDVEKAVALLGH